MAITFAGNTFTVAANTLLTGTGTITSTATTVNLGAFNVPATLVTGVGTSFTTQLVVGSLISPTALAGIVVHSIISNTSVIGFRSDNTNNVLLIATATAFQTQAPNTWADLLAAVALQAATVAQANTLAINFVASFLTINNNTVLIVNDAVSITFGNSAGFRLNNNNGTIIFRNGGSLTYTGNAGNSFFNGFLNVWNGELVYQLHAPAINNARLDFFSPSAKSNGISAINLIYSNADAIQSFVPVGTGAAGPYTTAFGIIATTDTLVFKDNVQLTFNTHYTVAFGAGSVAVVTLTAAGQALAPTTPTRIIVQSTTMRVFYFTHLEPLAGKFGILKFTNNTSLPATGINTSGINVQFGNGTYANVTLPSRTSTFGVLQFLFVYLARSGGQTILTTPTIPGSVLTIAGDGGSSNTTARLINEKWPDLAVGTVGSLARDVSFPGGTVVSRIYTYTPGTLFNAGNPVYLRIANNIGNAAINGAVTSNTPIELIWQTFSAPTNVTTNFGPFALIARRANMPEITESFTPVVPIVFSNPLETDLYFTSDASTQTGISAVNNATKTVTIDAGTTLTIDTRYDFLKHYLTQNLTVTNFLSPNGTVLSYLLGWSDVVNGTSNSGTKLVTTSTTGTVTIGAGGLVNHAFIDANQVGFITAEGSSGNTVELRNTSTNAVIRSRTGDGLITVAPADVGVAVYLARISGGNVIGSSVLTPVTLIAGDNGIVTLYFGNAVQVAQATRIELLPTLAQMEASTIIAKEVTVGALTVLVQALPQTGDVLDANIVKVNDIFVDGVGSQNDPWGPV